MTTELDIDDQIIESIFIESEEPYRIKLTTDNQADMFGYMASELIGQPVEVLVPDSIKRHHSSWVYRFFLDLAEGKEMGHVSGENRTVHFKHKDGREIPCRILIGQSLDSNRMGFGIVMANPNDLVEG